MKMQTLCSILPLIAGLVAFSSPVLAQADLCVVGPPLAELGEMVNEYGEGTTLEELAGGESLAVLVMKGAWCPVCARQLQRLDDLATEISQVNARLVAISPDSPDRHSALVQRLSVSVPVLTDPDSQVLRALNLWLDEQDHPMPSLLVFDACGNEHWRQVGRNACTRPEIDLLVMLAELADDPPSCLPAVEAVEAAPLRRAPAEAPLRTAGRVVFPGTHQ